MTLALRCIAASRTQHRNDPGTARFGPDGETGRIAFRRLRHSAYFPNNASPGTFAKPRRSRVASGQPRKIAVAAIIKS